MVLIKRHFIEQAITRAKIDEYLASQFQRARYSGVDIVQTPIGTRVTIFAERPALIIGSRGSTVRKVTEVLEKLFNLPNPQISVMNVENPDLDARVNAFRIASSLERGFHFRRVAFIALRRIMQAGAVGVEIVISGKLTGERARFEKYRAGKIYKTGEHVDYVVDKAIAHALLKKGIIGVQVTIVKEGKLGDYVRIKDEEEVKEFVEAIREQKKAEEEIEEILKEAEEEIVSEG
ncbi:MAG: 30S ribosomal protein S3 [Desulfurococcales archaeon]|nr:30S ribosomal protein S3 [Desulfurococcales archaeon]